MATAGAAEAGVRIVLQTACEDRSDLPTRGTWSRWANAAARGSGVPVPAGTEVLVRLVDDEEGARLNETFRGRRGATNVLSFPFEQPPAVTLPLLGDVVICVPLVRREARGQGKPLVSHLAHMMVHATLHLLGYDHDTDADARVMETIEVRVLARLGYYNPYEESRGQRSQR